MLEVRGASTHNLQGVDVDIPLGVLVVVTGVAGSGKSSLIHGSVSPREGVVAVDQGAIKGSRRSNPATYTGLLEPIRKAFAKANGVKPALEAVGCKYLARGGAHKVYEGDWTPRRIVLLEFPNVAAWETFYNGPTYQGLKHIRDACSSARLVSVEGL